MRAQLTKKGKASRGSYEENDEPYPTRQYEFRQEDGRLIRVNVNVNNKNVERFGRLKIGDWIEGYTMLRGSIIDPRTTFNHIPAKEKGGPSLF